MNSGEIPKQNEVANTDDSFVEDSSWAEHLEEAKKNRREAMYKYRTASEAFRMDFNERATGPEQFAEWVRAGEEGIYEEETIYQDEKIPVYHLTGHEFLALVHCIDFHGTPADKIIFPEVYQKSKAIRDDPSSWMTTPPENNPMSKNDGIAKTGSAKSLSCSLVSNKVPDGYWGDSEKTIYYGFSNIGRRGIITAGCGDMGAHQGWTNNIKDESEVRKIESLDEVENGFGANEVAFERYEEDSGRPITPDFILCPNSYGDINNLTDAQKQHAAYFGVPIVILHRDAYGKYSF